MQIIVKKTGYLNGWKEISLPNLKRFSLQELCICCSNHLETLVTHKGKNATKIRIGICPTCGFVTYIDKPSHEWILDFYSSTWNQNESKEENFVNSKQTSSPVSHTLKELGIKNNDLILEIGTGRGGNFASLQREGFTNLIGVENSKHRAELVSEKLNIPIFCGGFEEQDIQDAIKIRGNPKIIYSAHVIEHMYNPLETLQLASKLQRDNDFIIISVPHFKGEPTIGVLSFLPHLHSFTITSLSALLNRCGYKIISDALSTDEQIVILGQKTSEALQQPKSKINIELAREKIYKELHINDMESNKSYYYWFSRKKSKETGVFPISNMFEKIINKIKLIVLNKKKRIRSLTLEKMDDNNEEITIKYTDEIILFYK